MLDEASRMLGPDAARVAFCEGYIEDAPDGPFDAATCLLMLHFLEIEEPTSTAREPRRRLKPGAPFVTVHSSFPQGKPRAPWLSRYAAFALASGADFEQVEKMRGGGRGRAIAQSGTERSDSAKLISELDFEVNLRFHPTQLPRAAAR
jgi:tRNA (cmo5U34)-methyltransferase